jgi:23S rRNA (pseudouridine1915-N3)-methyltransferase
MRVALLAVGQRMPAWVREAFDDYSRRLRPRLPVTLVEIASGDRGSGDTARAMATEGKRLLAALRPADHVVLLDSRGATWPFWWEDRMALLPTSRSVPTSAGRCRH